MVYLSVRSDFKTRRNNCAAQLFEAFNALRPNLAPGERTLSYGSTTVVDLGTRNENPS